MILGIDITTWIIFLGIIVLVLLLTGKKKERADFKQVDLADFSKLADMSKLLEMRWVKVTVLPDEVPELLNKIEVEKISVMYQFFLNQNTGYYDMFLRCRESQVEELKATVLNRYQEVSSEG